MREAYIVAAGRSAIGRKKGALSHTRPDRLAAQVLKAVVARAHVDAVEVDDVVMGCVTQVGEQGLNIARNAALMAGFPVEVTGVSVNRMCGSSQQALNFAAAMVMSGMQDMVLAAGVECMSRVAMGSDAVNSQGNSFFPPDPLMTDHYNIIPQGLSAELVAERYGLSRAAIDQLSLESHVRAAAAQEGGRFDREIVTVQALTPEGAEIPFNRDEGVRKDTSLEKLAGLQPAFKPDGVITAGSSSQISDGAAAVLIASKEKADKLGLKPRAKIIAMATAGVDPEIMLTGPIPATRKALAMAGLKMRDVGLIEINEAFGSVVLGCGGELEFDFSRVNVNGGAIALGHPLGASGCRLMTTLLHEMERRDERFGLATMCIGFGQGVTTIIDRKV